MTCTRLRRNIACLKCRVWSLKRWGVEDTARSFMQDTNQPQFEFVRLLKGSSGNVLVVGDPDQAICKWLPVS